MYNGANNIHLMRSQWAAMVMVSKLSQVHSTLFQYKGFSVFRVSPSQTKKRKVLMSSELSEACLARKSSYFLSRLFSQKYWCCESKSHKNPDGRRPGIQLEAPGLGSDLQKWGWIMPFVIDASGTFHICRFTWPWHSCPLGQGQGLGMALIILTSTLCMLSCYLLSYGIRAQEGANRRDLMKVQRGAWWGGRCRVEGLGWGMKWNLILFFLNWDTIHIL